MNKNKQKLIQEIDCKDCVFLVECAIKCQELNKTQKEICPITKCRKEFEQILDEIFNNEIDMCCLKCGKSLADKIMSNKIHLHFCDECREGIIKKLKERI